MAKAPEAGRVKTRLVSEGFPDTWVAGLAAAFLTDTLAAISHPALTVRLNVEGLLALDGDPASLPANLLTIPYVFQRGNSLGERLVSLCDEVFVRGAGQLVIVGSDAPHLPTAFVQEAFGRLDAGADMVLGPADDGGYYLIGLKRSLPALFETIPWSTGGVLEATLNIAARENVRTGLLPSLYDIDQATDLNRLMTDLKRGVVSAPATAAYLWEHPGMPKRTSEHKEN